MNTHGGNESTILTLFNVFSHFGAVIVPPGYTDPIQFEAGGNPYGAAVVSAGKFAAANEVELAAARYQGRRLAEISAAGGAAAARCRSCRHHVSSLDA